MKKHIAFLIILSVIVLLTNCSSNKTKYGYINMKGEWVIKQKLTMPLAENPRNFKEGLVVFKSSNKYGYMDTSGKVVVKPQYDYAEDFSEGLAAVKAGDFSDGTAKVLLESDKGDRWGFINKQGELIIEPQYEKADDFSDGLAYVLYNGKRGHINKEGTFIVPPEYFNGHLPNGNFCNGIAAIVKDLKTYFVDKNGNFLFSSPYDFGGDFSEGLAYAELEGKIGYIDTNGNFAFTITGNFLDFGEFHEGLAYVGK